MNRMISWLWKRGFLANFMTGLFVLLPVIVTLAIMGWVGGLLVRWFGPGSQIGKTIVSWGGHFAANDWVAMVVGWVLVLVAIWLVGLLVKTAARQRLEQAFHNVISRIPVIGTIYKPVSQVVDMLKQDEQSDMQSMAVVYCAFGEQQGGGFLGLLASPKRFRFGAQICHTVYIPTSPVPMSGGIVFVPTDAVKVVEMKVEDLMQIYFSLGVMATKVVPEKYHA